MEKYKSVFIVVFVAVVFIISIVFVFLQREKKNIRNQKIDLTIQIQKLDYGDSLIISEFTHYGVINEIEKQLKNHDGLIWLGDIAYPLCGIGLSKNPSYPKNEKFVYLVDRSSNSYYEVLIEPRKLDHGIYTAKCLLVFVSIHD